MASAEYCICCGKEIPEGSQVCIMCGYKAKGKQRQIDRIRKMDIEELEKMVQELIADFICEQQLKNSGINVDELLNI